MKPLELTIEHKDKLLEMCKVLFPEYTTIPSDKNPKWLHIFYLSDVGTFIQLCNDEIKKSINIHWFEFCNTWLVEKVLNPTPERPSRVLQDKFKEFFWKSNLYWMYINEYSGTPEKHPVDYLYEEFKKLNN